VLLPYFAYNTIMNIKKRLRLSYILMLIIPIFLIALTGGLVSRINSKADKNEIILSSEFLKSLYSTMVENPEKILKKEFLIELDSLSGFKGETNIFIEKEGRVINSLIQNHMEKKIVRHGRIDAVQTWDFYFSDGTPGFITINIYDVSLVKEMFLNGTFGVITFICILILTNGLLSYFVARSIIKPIKLLKTAAMNIKHEKLDIPVRYDGRDEFLDVCLAFEEMRIRLKESLHEQQRYEENRKELLSNISHDLKTPITAIKGYIEGIKDGIADSPEKVEKYIQTVYTKSVLMNDLIDRLFLFSKLDMNKVQFNFQKIDLISYIKDTCDELKFDYPLLEIIFEQKEETPLPVYVDSMHIHRVFSNLIDNAVKYNDKENTVLTISLSSTNDLVTIELEDNSRGISSEYLPHIFERFYRTDKARSSMSEGSGLGLSISKQIISAHGGKISARSTVGQGTTIIFTLRRKP
jgi:histidine kinase